MKPEIKDELKEIAATLASIGNENSYRVPDNYFEDLAGEVMSKIQLPSVALPFTAPAPSYFEGLAGDILNKIKGNGTIVEEDSEVARELKELSPLVAGMKKVNVYTVPAGYFANFNVAVPASATGHKGKVVPLNQPIRWMRYAAAAAVAGIIAIGGMFLFRNSDSTGDSRFTFTKNYSAPLSSISDDAITSYLKESPAELDITPANYDESNINAGSLAEQLLNDVSEAAIQEYLQENQQPGEKDIKGI